MKQCQDCQKPLVGHGTPKRCKPCAARARYIARFGKPPEMLIAKCEVCDLEFQDYASNHKKAKHGVYFCSPECRVAWVGAHNSATMGGDVSGRSKEEKDALYYRRNAEKVRRGASAHYWRNRETILAKKKAADRALKVEVAAAYGGKCECCGETHIEFLTIDHTDGGGAAHRRATGKGRRIYADLKAQGFPRDRYRLLCLNCNIALGFYGYCPHRPDERRDVDKRPDNPGRKRTVK